MTIMRRLFGRAGAMLVVALLLVPLLAACGAEPTPTPAPPAATNTPATAAEPPTNTPAPAEPTATEAAAETPSSGALKVGLVTDVGQLNDKSFNQSSWEGVLKAQEELGIEAKAIETKDPKDYQSNMQQFLDDDYDVIVTVGFALGADTIEVAKENPDVMFIGVDQFQAETIENLAGLIFDEDKAGYLAGVLAASISQSAKIGAVCGTDDVPPVWKFGEGYKAGAKSVNPDVDVQVVYHSDVPITQTFTDPEWGKTTALSMIDGGVDVVFGAGGITGNGAIFAADERGIAAIGVDTDQYFTIGDEYKDALASSAMKLLTDGVYDLIKDAVEGNFKGGNNVGPVGLAPYHDWDSKISAEVKTKIEETDKGLKDGSIKTCVSPAKGAPAPEGCPAMP